VVNPVVLVVIEMAPFSLKGGYLNLKKLKKLKKNIIFRKDC
jgi:hypothetical protein